MKAVVLAAGEGTRLRPLTEDRPKGLVPVDGTPILTRCFATLADLGVDEIVAVVGYRKDDIVNHYGDGFGGIPIRYAVQYERRGLAHALLTAEAHVDDDFLVMNGDNVYGTDLSDLLALAREQDADVAFLTETVSRQEATTTGVCVTDEAGEVVGLAEKPDDPPSTLVPTGCYVLPPEAFPACHVVRPSERGEYELSDAIDLLVHAGYSVATAPLAGWRINVNTPADLERAERRLGE